MTEKRYNSELLAGIPSPEFVAEIRELEKGPNVIWEAGMAALAANDRITHRKTQAPAELDDLIDEVVVTSPSSVHVEMLSRSSAWMRIGEHVFNVWAEKGKLSIRYSERRPEDGRR